MERAMAKRVFVRTKPKEFCNCKTTNGYSSNPDYSNMPEAVGLWVCARCGWPTKGGWQGYLAGKVKR